MSLQQRIAAQFSQPRGALGRLAGLIMATRPSNIERSAWTLELLRLQPDDRVLEIGFGPGVAIERAARVVTRGRVVGIDHSRTMLKQAQRRNAEAIRRGVVGLHLGTVFDLPPDEIAFGKIYSANVVQFWPDPLAVFTRLRALLARGGTLATTYMPRHRGASTEDARTKAAEIEMQLDAAGFSSVRTEQRATKPVATICVLAR